jgi:hypothetical protein
MKNISLRNIIPVLGIVFFYSCSPKNIQKVQFVSDSISKQEAKQEAEYVAKILKFHNKLNVDSLLNSYNSRINIEKDLIIPLDTVVESDSSRVVVIGKFINEKDVFAFDIYGSWDKKNIDFYKLEKGKWNRIISEDYNCDVLHFSFENLNTDKDTEILFLGHPNMNGNRQHTIYKYDANENQFVKSGKFFCDHLDLNSNDNILYFEYGGSWYTPNEKSTYKWVGNKIIPIKKVSLELKKYDYKSFKQWIRYYENPTQDKDTLVLKYKKTYKEKNKKLFNLWENFFEYK